MRVVDNVLLTAKTKIVLNLIKLETFKIKCHNITIQLITL